MKTLAIYGTGGLGREILDHANASNAVNKQWSEIIFVVDAEYLSARTVNDVRVWSFDEFCDRYSAAGAVVVIGNGEPEIRSALADKVKKRGFELCSVIHPSAVIGSKAQIGSGTVVSYGCFISCNTMVGENVYVNVNVYVGHDTGIDADSVLSPNVNLSGNVTVGKRTYIGTGAMVKEGVSIGERTIIGMGAVVTKNIPDKVIAMGVPARVTAENTRGLVFGKKPESAAAAAVAGKK
ncbi:MAG: NeuD/PglB/VioB family sugar acetyltransferase [Victivallaceae bacterium]